MWFLYDNIVTFLIAGVACTLAWLFGGTMGNWLIPVVPWMLVLLLEGMLCFPQRHQGESTYEARERVWYRLKHDPLTWVTVGFLVLLMIPFLNTGLCQICDYAAIKFEKADPSPTVPFLPFCVSRMDHFNVVLWFLPSLVGMLAVKHALLKRGKRLLLELIVWNGVGLSLIGLIQSVTGAQYPLWADIKTPPAYFFSTFGYPNMGGEYFTTLFALAVALWRWKLDVIRQDERSQDSESARLARHKLFWRKHLMLVPAVIFFFSALTTLSRAAIILVTILAISFFLHAFASAFVRMPRAKRVKASAAGLFGLVCITLCTMLFMPDDLRREVDSLNTTTVLDRVTGKGQYHVRVATEIWKDYPFFGCGGWGYKHFCVPKMTDVEIKSLQRVGGINVHNDYLQFLAEHGLVGFGCLVTMVVLLVWPLGRIWRALMAAVRFTPPKQQPAKPLAIFVLPAPVFCILLAAAATFIHGFGDCPFRSPAVLMLFYAMLAAMDGFLPRLKGE